MDSAKSLHEINRYPDLAFPIGMYAVTRDQIVPDGRGYLDLHWHEELQFTLVTDGTLQMQVNGNEYKMSVGEGIFINRNLLHVTNLLSKGGRYISFNFPEKLLGFFPKSRMELDYVHPYTNDYAFPAVVLRKSVAWQEEILSHLWKMQDLMMGEKGFAYEVALRLTSIWLILIQNAGDQMKPQKKSYVRKQERMQLLLSFIHNQYMANIQLADIAAAANISKGECCRCFQTMVHESPAQYLLKYRLAKAMELLTNTDLSITQVALQVGFNDTSHFIHYFRQKAGVTPKEYRSTRK